MMLCEFQVSVTSQWMGRDMGTTTKTPHGNKVGTNKKENETKLNLGIKKFSVSILAAIRDPLIPWNVAKERFDKLIASFWYGLANCYSAEESLVGNKICWVGGGSH